MALELLSLKIETWLYNILHFIIILRWIDYSTLTAIIHKAYTVCWKIRMNTANSSNQNAFNLTQHGLILLTNSEGDLRDVDSNNTNTCEQSNNYDLINC